MIDDKTLSSWTGPSSTTEQDKQDRTERMIRDAIAAHAAFSGVNLVVYAKGSYPNNTNVRTDSDVDIAVECREVVYSHERTPGLKPSASVYQGIWTPTKLRAEVDKAMRAKFGSQVDSSGSTAIEVSSSSARVDADVVPCFKYRYYSSKAEIREGTKLFKTSGGTVVNWPQQHLDRGRAKNVATNKYFKSAVRILKRVENQMTATGVHRDVPSFFVECLVYNCPNETFTASTWHATIRAILSHIWQSTQGDAEPATGRWVEVNQCKYLFAPGQKWSRKDGREFAKAAWNHIGYKS